MGGDAEREQVVAQDEARVKVLFILEYDAESTVNLDEIRESLVDSILLASEDMRPKQAHIVIDPLAHRILRAIVKTAGRNNKKKRRGA